MFKLHVSYIGTKTTLWYFIKSVKASYRAVAVINITQSTQSRQVFLECKEFKSISFSENRIISLLIDFILLKTLRLCVLCENFFGQDHG